MYELGESGMLWLVNVSACSVIFCPLATHLGRAIAHKEEGNDLFRKRLYKEAVKEYSKGISEKSEDSELNAILYCNRAAAQFHLGKLKLSTILLGFFVFLRNGCLRCVFKNLAD